VCGNEASGQTVTVRPITHSPPRDPLLAVEIPALVKRRVGLDDARSWVILTEASRFAWPGLDLRRSPAGNAASVALGPLPYRLFEDIGLKFIAAVKARTTRLLQRTE